MSLIPERVWALLTDEEKAAHRAFLDGAGHAVAVACPACQHAFEVRLKLSAKVHSRAALAPRAALTRPETPQDRLLAAAEQSGVLDAFRQACEKLKATNRPTDIRAYFVQWAEKKALVAPGPAALAALRTEVPTGYLELWQWGGVVGVAADQQLWLFVPYDYVKGLSGGAVLQMRLPAVSQLQVWVRGRFGYVPAEARGFQEALQERSFGGFARLSV